jgi:alginate O-acetyltransferase complex protein AlgI
MLAYIAINYGFGLLVGRCRKENLQRWALALGIGANCGLLIYYKYFGFLIQQLLPDVFSIHIKEVHTPHLPLGISYLAFHGISYLVDIYRGIAKYAPAPLHVGIYLSMFPHLVAGPIVRYHTIAKALVRRIVTTKRVLFALRLFIIGLAQKTLIANTVGSVADKLFALPQPRIDLQTAWTAALSYTLQIYYDFCGYSFMAIALGIVLGFRLPRNFRYPYASCSITEFWRRWHISLSTWFRDYLYIPLGGNRKGKGRTYLNLLLVFFLCGLWHGAAYSFIVWGLFHGVLLVLERLGLRRILGRIPAIGANGYTMLMVMIGWVLFRVDNLPQAGWVLTALLGLHQGADAVPMVEVLSNEQIAAIALGLLFATPVVETLQTTLLTRLSQISGGFLLRLLQTGCRFLLLNLLFGLSCIYILAGNYSPFLYFRF